MKKKKIKIVSDGYSMGTGVFDENGELMTTVSKATIIIDAKTTKVNAVLEFNDVEIDIDANIEDAE